MRLLGYILLIGGFVAINWKMGQAREIIYGACHEQEQRMAQQQSYSHDEVRLAMVNAASTTWDRTAPWFVKPGFVMIIGGFLLDMAARQRRGRDNAAKTMTDSK